MVSGADEEVGHFVTRGSLSYGAAMVEQSALLGVPLIVVALIVCAPQSIWLLRQGPAVVHRYGVRHVIDRVSCGALRTSSDHPAQSLPRLSPDR